VRKIIIILNDNYDRRVILVIFNKLTQVKKMILKNLLKFNKSICVSNQFKYFFEDSLTKISRFHQIQKIYRNKNIQLKQCKLNLESILNQRSQFDKELLFESLSALIYLSQSDQDIQSIKKSLKMYFSYFKSNLINSRLILMF
jgi:hypothetical protein